MNNIPPMTDPMGAYWSQPDPSRILVDDTHAVMDAETFSALAEYSGSLPSGVYFGKMWKRHDGIFDKQCKPEQCLWLLCWFGKVDGKPNLCSNNFREILVV